MSETRSELRGDNTQASAADTSVAADMSAADLAERIERRAEIVHELRYLAIEVRQDLEPQELELREIAMLVKQASTEVDRLSPARNEAAKKLREVELNVEHFSRSDIAQAYGASAEAQMRLFMMQGRLEQLEYKQKTLERNRRNLSRFASLIEQLPDIGVEEAKDSKESHTDPQDLIFRIVQAEEDERQRCAQVVHDRSAQALSNLVLRAQLCQRLLETDEARARQELNSLADALSSGLGEARQLIFELRPFPLGEMGLLTTIRKYVQSQSERTNTPIEIRLSPEEARLDSNAEIAIFRLVQEAINNALRHSRANRVEVSAAFTPESFRALVEDDGLGFDPPDSIETARAKKQLGLAVMLERISLLGGKLEIESALGRGTTVIITVPIASEPRLHRDQALEGFPEPEALAAE